MPSTAPTQRRIDDREGITRAELLQKEVARIVECHVDSLSIYDQAVATAYALTHVLTAYTAAALLDGIGRLPTLFELLDSIHSAPWDISAAHVLRAIRDKRRES